MKKSISQLGQAPRPIASGIYWKSLLSANTFIGFAIFCFMSPFIYAVIIGDMDSRLAGFLFLLPFLGFAFAMTFGPLLMDIKKVDLMKNGNVTNGRIVSREMTNTYVNGNVLSRYKVEFTDNTGQAKQVSFKTSVDQQIIDDEEEILFYDPANSDKILFYDKVSTKFDIEQGRIVRANNEFKVTIQSVFIFLFMSVFMASGIFFLVMMILGKVE